MIKSEFGDKIGQKILIGCSDSAAHDWDWTRDAIVHTKDKSVRLLTSPTV